MSVEAWVCRPIDVDAWPLATCERLLSPGELDRAKRFVRPADAERFRAGHAALRLWLGEQLAMPPADLRFTFIGPAKKPVLEASPWHFNFSHTDDHWAAVAGAPASGAVGIDIERLDRFEGPKDELARMVLSPSERDAWRRLGGRRAAAALAQLWTRKEALLKAIGTGLRRPMASVSVGWESGGVTLCAPDAAGLPACWTLRDLLALPSGLVGAIAWQRNDFIRSP